MSSRLPVVYEFIGSTLRVTVVCSGATISPGESILITASETVLGSMGLISSGNGLYYADHPLPGFACHLANKVVGVISANTYVRYQLIEVQAPEVD